MLYAWYKIASILAIHSNRPLSHIGEEISLSFRVRLFDCDGFRIMSGFQYPTYMYLSSWALCTRARFPKTILTKRWAPVAASQKTIFWRPLKLWSLFTLKVSFAGWDDNWFYHQHVFQQKESVHALGTTRFAVWENRHIVPVVRVLDVIGFDFEEKPPPVWINNQFKEDVHSFNNFLD
jgi:acyl-CoA thioesterase FadM